MKHKIVGIIFCLLCGVIYAEPVNITLKDGTKWSGDMDQFITVEVELKGQKKIFEGDLTIVKDSYIVVGEEFVFISDIKSIKPVKETTELAPLDVNDEEVDSVDESEDKHEVIEPIKNEEELQTICVIPLIGSVGFVLGESNMKSNWFGGDHLEDMLKRAERAKAVEVILEIDSPGGLVKERNLICEVIDEYRDKFVITAYPHNSFSAASTIALTCDKLIASPDSKIGAAVVMSGGNAVDKKNASADASIARTYLANAGRSGAISDALSIVEAELWYNKSENKFSSREQGKNNDWIRIDGPKTVLTFDSQDLIDLKIASDRTSSLEMLYKNFSIESYAKRMNRSVGNAARAAERLDRDMLKFFGVSAQNDLDYWLDEFERALLINPRSDSAWAFIKKTERELRKKVHRMKMEAEDILEKDENGRYDFSISPRILGALKIVQTRGEVILDLDKMFDNVSIVRLHVDIILETLVKSGFSH
jgi:ATP-dependent protease ClpP protease subunit